jgi:hypothetical protein
MFRRNISPPLQERKTPRKVPGISMPSWRLKRHVPPKCRWTSTELHSVTTQNMVLFSNPCFDSLLKMWNNKLNMMDLKFSQQWLLWDVTPCSLVDVCSAGFLVVCLFGLQCFKFHCYTRISSSVKIEFAILSNLLHYAYTMLKFLYSCNVFRM